jgi:SAM-dependent methyltransferase
VIAYGADLAEIYEAVYRGRGKDYETEAAELATLIRRHHPAAESLLDVGCGTGGHLAGFAQRFARVTGLDISPWMTEIAEGRVPGVAVHEADMRSFALDEDYDAITCLFSSIGYLTCEQDLVDTLANFRRHLRTGGIVVVEPWWFPETFLDRYVNSLEVRDGTRTVVRVSHSVRDGAFSEMQVHYLVAEPEHGIRHFTDSHRMALFTRDQYEAAFRAAGLTVDYRTTGRTDRGLFIGRDAP